MLTILMRRTTGTCFTLGVAAGVFILSGVLLYQTRHSSYLQLPYFDNLTKKLGAITRETEDPVWGDLDRKWRPPSDSEDWGVINCNVPKMRNPDDFYDYIDRHELHCEKPVMSGGVIRKGQNYHSGEKWVCLDPRFNIRFGRCVVLSFGISKDFSFDDDMGGRFNCTVYSFDPTDGVRTHRRSSNVMFYDLGIANFDNEKRKRARYITILQKLQLEEAVIDYLKIDVERAEYQFFSDVFENTPNLLKNVKQIGMEVHVRGNDREAMWKYFALLRCYGFKVMFSEMNPAKSLRFKLQGHKRSCCYEVLWGRDKQW